MTALILYATEWVLRQRKQRKQRRGLSSTDRSLLIRVCEEDELLGLDVAEYRPRTILVHHSPSLSRCLSLSVWLCLAVSFSLSVSLSLSLSRCVSLCRPVSLSVSLSCRYGQVGLTSMTEEERARAERHLTATGLSPSLLPSFPPSLLPTFASSHPPLPLSLCTCRRKLLENTKLRKHLLTPPTKPTHSARWDHQISRWDCCGPARVDACSRFIR